VRVCLSCSTPFSGAVWTCPTCGYAPNRVDGVPVFAPEIADGHVGDAEYRLKDLSDAESKHFWFVARSRLIEWAIAQYFPSCRSLLDLGCGAGGVLAALRPRLAGIHIEGADALTSALGYATRRVADASFAQVDIGRLPYDREFDVVGAFDVIEHLDDDGRALEQMHRACTVGGGVIVTVPQHPFLWSAIDEYSCHRRRYTKGDLVRKLRAAGFAIERVTSFTTLLLPALLLVRARRQDAKTLDPSAELRIGSLANAIGHWAGRLERLTIQSGLSFPAGGSLLAIARRTS
jgi:SAM-dependent methyltransferase